MGSAEWLRGRGIGRERLAGHLGLFLEGYGYQVERTESTDPAETRLTGELKKTNPSVPPSGRRFEFRLYPTSGGCAVDWIAPLVIEPGDRTRFERLVREIQQHLERVVSTESHGTAKVAPLPGARRPWEPNGAAGSESPATSS